MIISLMMIVNRSKAASSQYYDASQGLIIPINYDVIRVVLMTRTTLKHYCVRL